MEGILRLLRHLDLVAHGAVSSAIRAGMGHTSGLSACGALEIGEPHGWKQRRTPSSATRARRPVFRRPRKPKDVEH